MARTIKHEEHADKRNDILDVAQKLIYTKGYEQMSVQDILDGLDMSKGAFYHYFGSKQALLEALVERVFKEAERLLLPVVHDDTLDALEKFKQFFATSTRWKTARKEFMLAILRAWYADENALFRQKTTATMVKSATPWLTEIIKQGVREGVFTTPYPGHVAGVVYAMNLGIGDAFAEMILSQGEAADNDKADEERLRRAMDLIAVYTDALERVLGVRPGSLELMDAKTVKEWATVRMPVNIAASAPNAHKENNRVAIVGNGNGR